MKWLRFMLCIYFTLLCFVPCSDASECTESTYTSISGAEDHQSHSHESELCSPFCICVCCGQSISFPIHGPVINQQVFPSEPYASIYQTTFPHEVHSAIWQPPKIG
jgi:hypothetical protein